jgi:hypothetical protein
MKTRMWLSEAEEVVIQEVKEQGREIVIRGLYDDILTLEFSDHDAIIEFIEKLQRAAHYSNYIK